MRAQARIHTSFSIIASQEDRHALTKRWAEALGDPTIHFIETRIASGGFQSYSDEGTIMILVTDIKAISDA